MNNENEKKFYVYVCPDGHQINIKASSKEEADKKYLARVGRA